MLGSHVGGRITLLICEISMYVITIRQRYTWTDGQTDRRHSHGNTTVRMRASRGKKQDRDAAPALWRR